MCLFATLASILALPLGGIKYLLCSSVHQIYMQLIELWGHGLLLILILTEFIALGGPC